MSAQDIYSFCKYVWTNIPLMSTRKKKYTNPYQHQMDFASPLKELIREDNVVSMGGYFQARNAQTFRSISKKNSALVDLLEEAKSIKW